MLGVFGKTWRDVGHVEAVAVSPDDIETLELFRADQNEHPLGHSSTNWNENGQ